MNYTAAVITVSDSCSAGTRQDTSGPRVCAMVEQAGYQVIYTAVVPDDPDRIQNALVHCADILRADLILTTGGDGTVSPDVTPEATRAVVDREIPAIPPGDAVCQPADYPPGHALPGGGGNPGTVPDCQSAGIGKSCP